MFDPLQQAFAIATQYHHANQLPQAKAAYEWILAHQPDHPDCLHQLGILLAQEGSPQQAIPLLQRATALQPAQPLFHLNLAKVLESLNAFDPAAASYKVAISLSPGNADLYFKYGNCLRNLGQLPQAQDAYLTAVQIDPSHHRAMINHGLCLKHNRQHDAAITCFESVLRQHPQDFQTHVNLAGTLFEMARHSQAVDHYHAALSLNSQDPRIFRALAEPLLQLGRLHEVRAAYEEALKLESDNPENYANVAVAYRHGDQYDPAIQTCRQALARWPENPMLWGVLASMLKDSGNVTEGIQALRKAIALAPENRDYPGDLSFFMMFDPDSSDAAVARELAQWDQKFMRPLRQGAAQISIADPTRRLRIAYLSSDFFHHVVGRNIFPLLASHDHQAFEIVCYFTGRTEDALTQRFRALADNFIPVGHMGEADLAARIRADRIDILVDLALHTGGSRLGVLASKPAPLQVTFAGYPGSTGLSAVDYRISDPYLDPSECPSPFVEQTLRLPTSFWCYDPLGDEPPVSPLPADAAGLVTFGCLNNFCKVNPQMLALWGELLAAIPNSRLVLLAPQGSHRQRTIDVLSSSGVSPQRISFANRQIHHEYLKLYHHIDISLDTLPYNGHTTSLDSLFMGVPVVTLIGNTVVGRAGVSQLSNLGMHQWIARTPQEYVSIATHWASHLPELAALRRALRSRMQASVLMDAKRFAADIENIYRQVWRQWCQTQTTPPA